MIWLLWFLTRYPASMIERSTMKSPEDRYTSNKQSDLFFPKALPSSQAFHRSQSHYTHILPYTHINVAQTTLHLYKKGLETSALRPPWIFPLNRSTTLSFTYHEGIICLAPLSALSCRSRATKFRSWAPDFLCIYPLFMVYIVWRWATENDSYRAAQYREIETYIGRPTSNLFFAFLTLSCMLDKSRSNDAIQ